MRHAAIELNIDELVLDGFAPSERYRIADAVQSELARLLSEKGLNLTRGAEVERLNANAQGLNSRVQSATTGAQIARAVYDGLSSVT